MGHVIKADHVGVVGDLIEVIPKFPTEQNLNTRAGPLRGGQVTLVL